MKWKIYYGDGSTFSDQDGTPWSAPGLDVQVLVVADKNCGWRTEIGDFYVWDDRGDGARWWGLEDRSALDEYLFFYPGHKCALMGRRISNDQFDEIFKRAISDPDLPKKTAFANEERKP